MKYIVLHMICILEKEYNSVIYSLKEKTTAQNCMNL